jgi:hypothetical protein
MAEGEGLLKANTEFVLLQRTVCNGDPKKGRIKIKDPSHSKAVRTMASTGAATGGGESSFGGHYRTGPHRLDLRSLAAFRILVGVYLLFDIYSRLSLGKYDLAWYTSYPSHLSYLEPDDTPHGALLHQFWFYRGSAALQLILFGITGILAILFSVGLFQWGSWESLVTKTTLFVLVTSYQNRNMLPHDGSDLFLRHLLFWSCFLPLSHVWSLDVILRSKTRTNAPTVSGLPCLAITTQILFMYWGTFFNRTADLNFNSVWLPPELSAVHYALSGSFATRHNFITKTLRANAILSKFSTATAMVVESVAPFACWALCGRAVSLVFAIILVALHGNLLCALNLPHWQFLAMLTQVVWIPTSTWDHMFPFSSSVTPDDTLRDYKKTDGDPPSSSSNTIKSRKVPDDTLQTNSVSRLVQVFFFSYMLYNFAGNRGWIKKHDNGDIGEGLRLSQYWVMYQTVDTSAHNTFVTGIFEDRDKKNNNTIHVDLFRYISSRGQGPLPLQAPIGDGDAFLEDMSSRYPSARWERAVHKFGAELFTPQLQARVRHFGKTLCVLVNQDRVGMTSPLLEVEVRHQHLQLLPPGSSTRYDKYRLRPDTVTHVPCDPIPTLVSIHPTEPVTSP